MNRIVSTAAHGRGASIPPHPHDDFNRHRQAMLVAFQRLLDGGQLAILSDAVDVVGETQRTMLQMATLRCREL